MSIQEKTMNKKSPNKRKSLNSDNDSTPNKIKKANNKQNTPKLKKNSDEQTNIDATSPLKQKNLNTPKKKAKGENTQDENVLDEKRKFGVFVGSLDFKTKKLDLKNIFKDCRTESIVLIRDPITQKPKNSAFVNFKNEESMTIALTKNGTELHGRKIQVSLPKKVKKSKVDLDAQKNKIEFKLKTLKKAVKSEKKKLSKTITNKNGKAPKKQVKKT